MLGLVLASVYLVVMVFLLGMFLGDEMAYKNPEYGLAIIVAVGWPVAVLYAGYNWVTQQ